MKNMTRKGVIITSAVAVTAVIGGGVAFAYWTSQGTGSGTAAADSVSDIAVTQLGSVSGLYPDGPAQDVDVTITNSNTSPVTIGALSTSVSGTDKSGCTAADFEVVGGWSSASVAVGATDYTAVATIQMVDTGVDQNACKGATVYLAFAAS